MPPIWETWSPTWHFSEETFNRTAASFDNPDFVDVVIHSYRHRNWNAPGEGRFLAVERQLAERPKITVPTIVLYGADDGVARPPADSPAERALFPALGRPPHHPGRRTFPAPRKARRRLLGDLGASAMT